MLHPILNSLRAKIVDRPLRSGTMLKDRYRIQHVIGIGSYGITYKAYDTNRCEACVLKQVKPSRLRNEKDLASFQNEIKIMKSLCHPGIPNIRDAFDDHGLPFIAMDYIPGETFEDLLFRNLLKLNEYESFQVVKSLLHILKYLHEQNIVHRDIRIPNVIKNGENLYLIDFGLARYIEDSKMQNEDNMKAYAIEKQLRREISFKSDFYALGHFVLFLLYSSYEPQSPIERSWEEELNISISSRMLIRRLLQIDPPYENVDELISDLEHLLYSLSQ